MGVTSLWSILEENANSVKLQELRGQKVAIDLSFWVLESEKAVTVQEPVVVLPPDGPYLVFDSATVADAEGALIALGYKPQLATRMVAAINDESINDSEELIRRALKSTVRG